MPSSRDSRSSRPSDSRRSNQRSTSRPRQTDARNSNSQNRRKSSSTNSEPRSNKAPQGRKRTAPKSVDKERARVNRLTAIILVFIAIVVVVVVVIGVRSASTTIKANGGSILSMTATPTPDPTATPAPTQTPKPVAATEKDVSEATITKYDTLLTVDGTAYEYYKFNKDNATATINAVNSTATSLGSDKNVYAMMIPSGIDIMLPLSLLDELADVTSDQQKAESYILTSFDASVKTVATYDQLKAYCDQDLYFNTDNHISGLCGYYLYQQWAAVKGVSPISLSSCTEKSYSGFYGNVSNSTGLSLDEDTVTVYDPGASFSYNYMDDYGSTQDGSVFVDVSDYAATQKYQAFLGGVHTRSEITNNNAKDNSSCVLVIDSNGTSIAPFIATHYKNTYIVDYRYSYETDSLSKIVSDTGATDVIFCLSMGVTGSGDLASGLTTLCAADTTSTSDTASSEVTE